MKTWGVTISRRFLPPTANEIKNARPLVMVLPKDVVAKLLLWRQGC